MDSYLGIHAQALPLEARRNELLAANLANADTPNYKARDLDFKAALSAAAASRRASNTGARPDTATAGAGRRAGGALTAASASELDSSAVKYRVPMAPALDGNTVDEQLEQSAFAENSVRYQATLQLSQCCARGPDDARSSGSVSA